MLAPTEVIEDDQEGRRREVSSGVAETIRVSSSVR